ncbi:hypothetical protein BTM165_08730 [Helicobacter pylori]
MKISNNAYKNDSSTNPFNVKSNKYISKLKTKDHKTANLATKTHLVKKTKPEKIIQK